MTSSVAKYRGIVAGALDAMIHAEIVPVAVAIAFTVVVVVLLLVAHQVPQGVAIMAGHEIDAGIGTAIAGLKNSKTTECGPSITSSVTSSPR